MSKLRFALSALVILACGHAQVKYTIQDLGSLAGMPTCYASALSQSGTVTGYCIGANVTAGNSGFLYSKGSIKESAPESVGAPCREWLVTPTGCNRYSSS